MVELQGKHGTTRTRANNIRDIGFLLNDGIRGFGVYFWRENAYFRDLAIAWFVNARNLNNYKDDPDRRCAVISAAIVVGDDEWLDLNDPDVEDRILDICKKNDYVDTMYASKLYEEYYELVQEEMGAKIKLVQARVMPPKSAKNWLRQAIGPAICYIVRDRTCITINNIETIENREIET